MDVARIVNSHLFGTAQKTQAAIQPTAEIAFVLTGTMTAEPPVKAMAVLGTSAAQTHVYPVGAQLPGDYRLAAVYSDRVILSKDASSLIVPLRKLSPGISALQGQLPVTTDGSMTATQELVSESSSDTRPETYGNWGRSDFMRPQPINAADGQIKAVRLFPLGDRARFARLGLRPGDEVTQINGAALPSAPQLRTFFESFEHQTPMTLTVRRSGKAQQIVVNPGLAFDDENGAPAGG